MGMDVVMEVNSETLGREPIYGTHHRGQLGEAEACKFLAYCQVGWGPQMEVRRREPERGGCSMLSHPSRGPSYRVDLGKWVWRYVQHLGGSG